MKRETNFRYTNSWIDFCWDGMFAKERIKGKDKRRLGKCGAVRKCIKCWRKNNV